MPPILAAAIAAFGSLTAAARMLGADTLCMAMGGVVKQIAADA